MSVSPVPATKVYVNVSSASTGEDVNVATAVPIAEFSSTIKADNAIAVGTWFSKISFMVMV